MKKPFHHHYKSATKRAVLSFLLVFSVMLIGTLGVHWLEKMSYVDAFYFMSMIATAQGSNMAPSTVAGKIFVAGMSFLSVGCVVTALTFLFGPFFTRIWHISVQKIEEEARVLKSGKKS